MGEWISVLSLIGFGLVLIVAEIVFVPGTTLVGIIGFVLMVLGITLSFRYFGSTTGWIATGGTAVSFFIVIYFCFKSNVWSRFSLKTKIDSKVNEGEMNGLQVGQEGVTLSSLRPIGKAELNSKIYEVKTFGNYLDPGKKVKIVEILSNQIVVEQIN
jgi:membrane-bound ClpP family serine protease